MSDTDDKQAQLSFGVDAAAEQAASEKTAESGDAQAAPPASSEGDNGTQPSESRVVRLSLTADGGELQRADGSTEALTPDQWRTQLAHLMARHSS